MREPSERRTIPLNPAETANYRLSGFNQSLRVICDAATLWKQKRDTASRQDTLLLKGRYGHPGPHTFTEGPDMGKAGWGGRFGPEECGVSSPAL